eukprot:gb/GECH01010396.1/.p1 GENE.gb/GECH01010396.1/~~gb/GECH01010396.1/.p1  ORF type:complete len:967 (+),score=243.05 gb/GECH01010396.1/:1-2901(+)
MFPKLQPYSFRSAPKAMKQGGTNQRRREWKNNNDMSTYDSNTTTNPESENKTLQEQKEEQQHQSQNVPIKPLKADPDPDNKWEQNQYNLTPFRNKDTSKNIQPNRGGNNVTQPLRYSEIATNRNTNKTDNIENNTNNNPLIYNISDSNTQNSKQFQQQQLQTQLYKPKRTQRDDTSESQYSSSNTDFSDTPDEGNIRVAIRLRPLDEKERKRGDRMGVWSEQDGYTVSIENESQSFGFDTVLDENSNQKEVFRRLGVNDLLQDAMQGYNGAVLAYGQTGSGKTYTMCGPEGFDSLSDFNGVIPRSAELLFYYLPDNTRIQCSFLEIYNEKVNDLLDVDSVNLRVRWRRDRGFYPEGLLVVDCNDLEDMQAVLTEGISNRKVSSHELNKDSSRSHSIFTVFIEREWSDGSKTLGKLDFVDLAGSERLKISKSRGVNAKETAHINKSLLTLAKVISCLSSNDHNGHIPYRESKLTRLLMDSVGGNSKTTMIACVPSSSSYIEESLQTLLYASRTKYIRNNTRKNVQVSSQMVQTLMATIDQLKTENRKLKDNVKALEVQLNKKNTISSIDSSNSNASDKIPLLDLRNPLDKKSSVKMSPIKTSKDTRSNVDLSNKLEKALKEKEDLENELSYVKSKLEEYNKNNQTERVLDKLDSVHADVKSLFSRLPPSSQNSVFRSLNKSQLIPKNISSRQASKETWNGSEEEKRENTRGNEYQFSQSESSLPFKTDDSSPTNSINNVNDTNQNKNDNEENTEYQYDDDDDEFEENQPKVEYRRRIRKLESEVDVLRRMLLEKTNSEEIDAVLSSPRENNIPIHKLEERRKSNTFGKYGDRTKREIESIRSTMKKSNVSDPKETDEKENDSQQLSEVKETEDNSKNNNINNQEEEMSNETVEDENNENKDNRDVDENEIIEEDKNERDSSKINLNQDLTEHDEINGNKTAENNSNSETSGFKDEYEENHESRSNRC